MNQRQNDSTMRPPLGSRVRLAALVGLAAIGLLTVALVSGLGGSSSPTDDTALVSSDDGPGDISGPCDEAEHANDARCTSSPAAPEQERSETTLPTTTPTTTSTTVPTTVTTSPAPPVSQIDGHLDAAGAGTVTYTVADGSLTLVEATPAPGWTMEIEQSAGRELDLDFRSGERRVQVDVELEDGHVRERVRPRED